MTYQIANKMKLGGGCMPLYSSKSSRQEYHETRRKYQQNAEISLPIPQDSKNKTLVYQAISIHMQEDKPPRGVHHFSSTIYQDKHPKCCTRER
jgi:hypothetical protein